MVDLLIESTASTPEILFYDSGTLSIKGFSRPEDSRHFYRQTLDWIGEYSKKQSKATTLNLNFSYLDSPSVRCIADILKAIYALENEGFDVIVNWYYDEGDEDLYDLGEALRATNKLKVNLIELDID